MATPSDRTPEQAFSNFLTSIVNRVPGLQSVVISDRDGVVLTTSEVTNDRDFSFSETVKVVTATYAASADQSGKCMLGINRTMVTFYENRVIVQFNAIPLVITIAGEPSANVGLLLQLQPDILTAVEPLRQQLLQIERENTANV